MVGRFPGSQHSFKRRPGKILWVEGDTGWERGGAVIALEIEVKEREELLAAPIVKDNE